MCAGIWPVASALDLIALEYDSGGDDFDDLKDQLHLRAFSPILREDTAESADQPSLKCGEGGFYPCLNCSVLDGSIFRCKAKDTGLLRTYDWFEALGRVLHGGLVDSFRFRVATAEEGITPAERAKIEAPKRGHSNFLVADFNDGVTYLVKYYNHEEEARAEYEIGSRIAKMFPANVLGPEAFFPFIGAGGVVFRFRKIWTLKKLAKHRNEPAYWLPYGYPTQAERVRGFQELANILTVCDPHSSLCARLYHNDINPENVCFDPATRRFLLIDFGNASLDIADVCLAYSEVVSFKVRPSIRSITDDLEDLWKVMGPLLPLSFRDQLSVTPRGYSRPLFFQHYEEVMQRLHYLA